MERVFLDANVLFSAAYGLHSGLLRLWQLDDVTLLTSAYAVEEVRRNLTGDERIDRLNKLLEAVEVISTVSRRPLPHGVELHAKDQPILCAAIDARATHLLTGDKRHFGHLHGQTVVGVCVLMPAAYLRARDA